METAKTLELMDIFRDDLTREKKVRAMDLLGDFVKGLIREERLSAAVETSDRIEAKVERAVEQRVETLATKSDIAKLKVEIGAVEKRLILWLAGMLVTILLGFFALMFAIKTQPAPYPQTTEIPK